MRFKQAEFSNLKHLSRRMAQILPSKSYKNVIVSRALTLSVVKDTEESILFHQRFSVPLNLSK